MFRFPYRQIYRIVKYIFLLSLLVLAVSSFKRQELPAPEKVTGNLNNDPVQTPTDVQPFEAEKNGIIYVVTPLYNYELNGMIVSYHHSSDWFDYYHEEWKDYINIEDICVLWGDNVSSGVYQKMKFENKSFSCWESFKPEATQQDWGKFRADQWSNNHILTNNSDIEKKALAAKTGDQIRMKGYLVKYSVKGKNGERTSSTTRDDTSQNACEVIFVNDFEIMEASNPEWQEIYDRSKQTTAAAFLLLILLFFKTISPYESEAKPKTHNSEDDEKINDLVQNNHDFLH